MKSAEIQVPGFFLLVNYKTPTYQSYSEYASKLKVNSVFYTCEISFKQNKIHVCYTKEKQFSFF